MRCSNGARVFVPMKLVDWSLFGRCIAYYIALKKKTTSLSFEVYMLSWALERQYLLNAKTLFCYDLQNAKVFLSQEIGFTISAAQWEHRRYGQTFS